MAKVYTAKEMRYAADNVCSDYTFAQVNVGTDARPFYRDIKPREVADMLRQAADDAEKLEEKASRIALWSGRADELRQQCDRWYKAANDAQAEVKNLRGCLQEAVNLHCGKCINKGGLCNSDCLFDKWKKALKEGK